MTSPDEPLAPRFFLILGLVVVGAALYLVAPHVSYYLQPIAHRPLHPDHDFLRPSGRGGLSFGVVAIGLIILNLSYLVRKRLLFLEWLGGLRSWMAFHVFTGLTAGTLALFHSAFRPRSALGILAFGAMAIVILTGLVGRYIYAHTPRSLEGQELELAEIRQRLEDYRRRLVALGMPTTFFTEIPDSGVRGSDKDLWEALVSLIAGNQELRQQSKELRLLIQRSPTLHPLAKQALPLAQRFIKERQWAARYTEMRQLMSGWRFLHRWLAILLVVAVAFHILVAWRMGNLWIFRALP